MDGRSGLDRDDVCQRMAASAAAIGELVAGIHAAQAIWRPEPTAWSMLEVINHLADEEREDFRARLEATLHQPQLPLPPIDPVGWVTARAYNERDLAESLARFRAERAQSLDWLRQLRAPDWERQAHHPRLTLRAGDLVAAWAAHDLLHLRQLVELHYAYAVQAAAPFGLEYAGEWSIDGR